MSLRFSRVALAALLVIVAHQSAPAQFTVLSQNTLHLGWGKAPYQLNKNTYMFNNIITPGNFDVVILQEVMQQANLAAITTGFLPGTYNVVQTPALGPGTYKETYGFLVRVPARGERVLQHHPDAGQSKLPHVYRRRVFKTSQWGAGPGGQQYHMGHQLPCHVWRR